MNVDLVKTTSSDGVRLDGALHLPPEKRDRQTNPKVNFDAVICLSGVASNFYGSTLMEEITPALLEFNAAVLWANTRGHDGFYTAAANGQRQGAAYEVVDQCRLDVSAWVEYLAQRGYARLLLLGHSLGAIKSLYCQAYQGQSAVCGIVAISPPRLSFSAFGHGPSSEKFFSAISTAQQHVDAGKPETLLEVDFPFPLVITAAGYLDKYGRQERYNILKFSERVTCPILFCYGELELSHGGVAFAGLPEALAALSWPKTPCQTITVAGADHLYRGRRDALAHEITTWLSSLFSSAGAGESG